MLINTYIAIKYLQDLIQSYTAFTDHVPPGTPLIVMRQHGWEGS